MLRSPEAPANKCHIETISPWQLSDHDRSLDPFDE